MAGSSRSATGARKTVEDSAGSTAKTSEGRCHQPITGVTMKLVIGSSASGSTPRISTPAGSSPVSSSASRSGGGDGVGVLRVDLPAGERHLAGVLAQRVGAGHEEHVQVLVHGGHLAGSRHVIEPPEEDQHRCVLGPVGRSRSLNTQVSGILVASPGPAPTRCDLRLDHGQQFLAYAHASNPYPWARSSRRVAPARIFSSSSSRPGASSYFSNLAALTSSVSPSP